MQPQQHLFDAFDNEICEQDQVVFLEPNMVPSELNMGVIVRINKSNYGLGDTLEIVDVRGAYYDRVLPTKAYKINKEQYVFQKLRT